MGSPSLFGCLLLLLFINVSLIISINGQGQGVGNNSVTTTDAASSSGNSMKSLQGNNTSENPSGIEKTTLNETTTTEAVTTPASEGSNTTEDASTSGDDKKTTQNVTTTTKDVGTNASNNGSSPTEAVTTQSSTDVNECKNKGNNTCDENAECTNTPGNYTCACYDGYQGNGTFCEDVDECKNKGNNSCDENARCTNTPGNYTCACYDGYQGNGTFCEDVDECKNKGNNSCDENARCTNTPGNYTCACYDGYQGNGTFCEDVDECKNKGNNSCDENARCTNTPGNYTCACYDGYQGNGTFCEDVDECKNKNNNSCDENASCTNTPGSYVCACDHGYQGNGTFCEDFDECEDNRNNTCDENANCTNTQGGFNCTCHHGYEGNGNTCKDVDECKNKNNNSCDENASCTNTPGSYVCACDHGYQGNGTFCEDFDECMDDRNNTCDKNANCTNTQGSFNCTCHHGYEGNGNICKVQLICKKNTCGNGYCEQTGVLNHTCHCDSGWTGKSCHTDVDECDGTQPCFDNEECKNNNGSYQCNCKENYYRIEEGCMKKNVFHFSNDEEGLFGKRIQNSRTELPISFPYFDQAFKYIHAHEDGYVSFGVDFIQSFAPREEYWPDYPPLVGIYWTDLDINQTDGGGMYVHKEDRTHNVIATSEFWGQLDEAVNDTNFKPLAAVAFTWIDAYHYPRKYYPKGKLRAQVIFASDGVYTYMVRNYDITWPLEDRRLPVSFAHTGKDKNKTEAHSKFPKNGEGDRLVDKLFDGDTSSQDAYNCFNNIEDLKYALRDPKPSLSPCPCLKRQADGDPSYKKTGDDSCYSNRFFRNGWKQRCCYDRNGLLLKNDKTAKYPEARNTTLKSSYEIAYETCCNVSQPFLCSTFYKELPSDDCSNYNFKSGGGGGFGDPHIINFDGDKFTFNIVGDFTLLKLSNVEIQGRTEESSDNTTFFTSFAFKIGDSSSYIMEKKGGALKGAWTDDAKKADPDQFQEESSTDNVLFYAILDSTVLSMKVNRKKAVLNFVIKVDAETDGLMGNNNKKKEDDFNGVKGPAESLSGEQIQEFAQKWQVAEESKSLFKPPFHSEVLTPPPNGLNEVKKALQENNGAADFWTEVCGDDLFCLQDLYVTNDKQSAKAIKEESELLETETEDIPNPANFQNSQELHWNFEEGNISLTLTVPGANSYVMSTTNQGFQLSNESLKVDLSALRKTSTSYPMSLRFVAKTDGKVIASYSPRVKLCLCESQDQCLEQSSLSKGGDPNGNVINMDCKCGNEREGRYCENKLDKCSKCVFECNKTLDDPCPCQKNFTKNENGKCYEVDECQDNNGGCEHNCENVPGSRTCSCRKGYNITNETQCLDIKECEDPTLSKCQPTQFCVEEPGSFSCNCFPGFGGKDCIRAPYRILGNMTVMDWTWKEEYDNKYSEGYKEFTMNLTNAIEQLIENVNTSNFYVEIVSLGEMSVDPRNNKSLIEAVFVINSDQELGEGSIEDAFHLCTREGVCYVNGLTFGHFALIEVSEICELPDIPNSCDKSSTKCKMVKHQTICSCKKGFIVHERDPFSCQDINECEKPKFCGKYSCTNTPGGFICGCSRGETWINNTCVAFPDPCSSNPCHNGGSCEDSGGKPVCLCSYGWEGEFCDEEEEEATRMEVAVIAISSVLGAFSLILIIVLAVLCYRMRRTVEPSTSTESSLEYTGSHKIPRPKMASLSQRTANGSNPAYDSLDENTMSSRNDYVRPDYDDPKPYTYQNKAYHNADDS